MGVCGWEDLRFGFIFHVSHQVFETPLKRFAVVVPAFILEQSDAEKLETFHPKFRWLGWYEFGLFKHEQSQTLKPATKIKLWSYSEELQQTMFSITLLFASPSVNFRNSIFTAVNFYALLLQLWSLNFPPTLRSSVETWNFHHLISAVKY